MAAASPWLAGKSIRETTHNRENVAASAGGGILFQNSGNADTLTIEGGILDGNVANGTLRAVAPSGTSRVHRC